MACLECRRRRIRCDATRPKCQHCSRLSKNCEYALGEQRRGPKKRSVKELEQRLATVEAQLYKAPGPTDVPRRRSSDAIPPSEAFQTITGNSDAPALSFEKQAWTMSEEFDFSNIAADFPFVMDSQDWPDTSEALIMSLPVEHQPISEADKFPDVQEVQELNKIFFDEVYPCTPFIHPSKHDPTRLHALDAQPPLCLRYVMWAHAAARSSKYATRAPEFYRNARMHLEHDEMQGDGLNFTTVAHVQTWSLIAVYEIENATPARAFMSSRRAMALGQMLGLHRTDDSGRKDNETFKLLRPAINFIEAEERRRTFWYLYFSDCWASAGSGKSCTVKEEEISVLMPASEEAFKHGFFEERQTLAEAAKHGLSDSASPIAAAVLSGSILSRCTSHLRQAQTVEDDFEEQQFWLRHQQLDNTISEMLLSLPDHLRAASTRDPLAFFINMTLHEFTISIFQAAIVVAQKSPTSWDLVLRLRSRSRRAAEEIVDIMRTKAYMEVRKMAPYTPSTLYIAATVFINDLNQGYNVQRAKEIVRFLLHTMKLFRRYFKMAQMFVAQLLHNLKDCDIELETAPSDAIPLGSWTKVGEEFDALGPLFADDTLLDVARSKAVFTKNHAFADN